MNELLKEHKRYGDIELSDDELDKLKGDPKPGKWINIYWIKDDEYPEFDRIVDEGYLISLPISDESVNDYFVHIPNPDNSSGIGDADPEWIHINCLLKNENVESIKVIS